MNMDPIRILSADEMAVAYRPEFARYLGSVTAAILLQQIIFRWENNKRQPFYKFKEEQDPDSHHRLYTPGDSWCEELAFTRREFDSALKVIGQKLKKGSKKHPFALVYYWIDMDRVTRYEINAPALRKVASVLYDIKGDYRNATSVRYVKSHSAFTESAKRTLDITETCTKTCTDTTLSLTENSKKIERTESGAIDAKQFTKTVTAEQDPKEAPPVAPPPPEMDEFEMKDKAIENFAAKATMSQSRFEVESMKSKYPRTFDQMKEEASRFAQWHVKRMILEDDSSFEKILRMSENMSPAKVQTIYATSFWSRQYKASNTTTTNRSNGKSNSYEKPRRKSRSEVEWESLRSFPDFAHLPKWTPDFYDVSPYTYGQTQGENVGSESGTEAAGHTIVVDGDNVYGYAN